MPEPEIITRATVTPCLNCGGRHQVDLTRYNARGTARDHPYWTHWALCPVTKDPISFRIVDEPNVTLPQDVMLEIVTAIRTGRYMIGVWKVVSGAINCFRNAVSFPKSDYPIAQSLLAKVIREETHGPEVGDLPDAGELPDKPLFKPGGEE